MLPLAERTGPPQAFGFQSGKNARMRRASSSNCLLHSSISCESNSRCVAASALACSACFCFLISSIAYWACPQVFTSSMAYPKSAICFSCAFVGGLEALTSASMARACLCDNPGEYGICSFSSLAGVWRLGGMVSHSFHKIGFWLPSFLVFKSTLYNIGRIEGFPRYKVPQVCRSIFFAFVKANAYFRAFVEVCKSARGWVLVSSQKAREKCWHGVNFGFGKTTLLPLHRATLPPVGNGIIFEFLFRPKESWRVRRGSNPKPAL